MKRSLKDLEARADALADAFEDYEPTEADLGAPLPPLTAVRLAAWRRDAAERDLAQAVRAAREENVSWRKVGDAIGTSGEAARQRYAPL
ncbi:MAG: hypothetical protein LBC97_02890 [Bifidobacteriaceae bacterium]|jgi:hypothetical protein|nr:hypothetical protein [Bifidobacteriaceae bacterium]